jgi:RNA polymerase sigma-70 factor (ECF subfamily)
MGEPMDPRAFEQLVERHYADLYRFALSLARNPDDAADLVQQTFATFARKGDDLRDGSKAKSWLFTTLYRDFLRQGARARRVVSIDEAALENTAPADPCDDAPRAAERQELRDALASLDDSQRAILSLFYIDQHSYKEIAAVLGLPIGTVMSRLSRAKDALRSRLQNGDRSSE